MSSPLIRPTPLEVASGVVLGTHRDPIHSRASVRPRGDLLDPVVRWGGQGPLDALRAAVLPALQPPPCLVSFSGGLDSSFVLAVAIGVARHHGLPAPVACTWRVSGAPLADESLWQERVIASLGLPDWVKLTADDDLDLVGPVSQRLLHRHGVLFPANAHLHLPIVELASGGSLLTGVGGDQILSGHRRGAPAPAWLRGGVSRPVRAAVRRATVRHAAVRHGGGAAEFPWLVRRLARKVHAGARRQRDAEPRSFDRRVAWHTVRRDLVMGCSSLAAMGSDHDVSVVHPLIDDRFVAALAHSVGPDKVTGRPALLAAIGAHAISPVIYAPRRKALFLQVFLRAPTRTLVESWDGSGADPAVVDVAALQHQWSRWPIAPGTAGLVQQVWLSANRKEHPATFTGPRTAAGLGVRP